MALEMTTDWADVLNTVKRRCSECGQYKDSPAPEVRKVPDPSWVCPDCQETLAEGIQTTRGL